MGSFSVYQTTLIPAKASKIILFNFIKENGFI